MSPILGWRDSCNGFSREAPDSDAEGRVLRVRASGGREAHILVVDDDTSSAQALVALLDDEGYTAAIARSGAEASADLATGACWLLLVDPSLSDSTGPRVLDDAGSRGVPTIVMTSDPTFDPERTRRHRVAGFLYKPIRLAALLSLIDAASKPDLPS
jgi:DNA-binding NtrC family response regulator